MNGFVSFCSTGTFGIVKNRPRRRPRFGKTGIEDDDENDYDGKIGALSVNSSRGSRGNETLIKFVFS